MRKKSKSLTVVFEVSSFAGNPVYKKKTSSIILIFPSVNDFNIFIAAFSARPFFSYFLIAFLIGRVQFHKNVALFGKSDKKAHS